MGKKMPLYVVFNMRVGNEFHKPVAWGDDFNRLMVQYHGSAYQVMRVRPVNEREEW
jgi:hypothetical protein